MLQRQLLEEHIQFELICRKDWNKQNLLQVIQRRGYVGEGRIGNSRFPQQIHAQSMHTSLTWNSNSTYLNVVNEKLYRSDAILIEIHSNTKKRSDDDF